MITTPGQVNGPVGRTWDRIGRGWDRFAAPTERYRRPFRRWRRGRPFIAGICVLLAAVEIPLVTQSAVGKLLSMGIPGVSTLFISVFLAIFAVTIWFFPAYRVFSGIAAIMVALLSLVATNLGGFLLGFLLAMFGGSFAVAWAPRTDYTADTRRQRRRARRAGLGDAAASETSGTVALSVAQADVEAESAAEHLEPEPAGPATENTNQSTETAAEDEKSETAAVSTAEQEPVEDPEYADNTRIIEHYARPDEAAEAAPEPAPEEE
ncbi:hypothetical protein KDL01_14565 [Actinospica durhamensis]|uniref:Uncharacterized protein n=1 Tax=Actinospica durhamensis TaxID=1508375 RepID=A0A941IMR4_9ACTN|nr:DUF6114 domain-containing protein [Actinospica durhamensis]MBR7834495.1 hypothetical protein [Actinospica durhamensis]